MASLFRTRFSEYTAKTYEVARSLLKSRNNQRARAQRLTEQLRDLQNTNSKLRQQLEDVNIQLHSCQHELDQRSQSQDEETFRTANLLMFGNPLRGHQFTAKIIALSINLAKRIGFRRAEDAMETMFSDLGFACKVPSHHSIRQWTLRLGVGELEDTFHKDQDVLWMADHSNQIGKEKVLLIVGIELKNLPKPGETLRLDDIKVLAIVPGEQWKKEDVAREYQKLAEQIGAPRFLVCDGAIELREPAESLEKDGRKTVALGDVKHVAANLLEKHIGRDERFKTFLSQVGLSRNRTQQTELSHFTPPPLKQKSRFMNLAPLLLWASMVLHHLSDPESESRANIAPERMREKLGWLEEYREDLKVWSACQDLIDKTLSFINQEGLSQGAAERLRHHLGRSVSASWSYNETFMNVFDSLMEHMEQSEAKLAAGERAWLSTEILESLFGKFKQLEGQHSKGGFTSLLAALPTLCCHVDAAQVRQRLMAVPTKRLKQWIQSNIGQTLTSRRVIAYKEYHLAQRVELITT